MLSLNFFSRFVVIIFAIIYLFYSPSILANTHSIETVYINNACSKEGDGSYQRPFNNAGDIPRAILKAGMNGTINIAYGNGEIYQLTQTLNLLPGQTLVGTDEISGTTHNYTKIAGNIVLANHVNVSYLNLLFQPNADEFAIKGRDVNNIIISHLIIGENSLVANKNYHYGLYFDTSGTGQGSHIIIRNVVVKVSDLQGAAGVIAITIGECYKNVIIDHSLGLAKISVPKPNLSTDAIGILSDADDVLLTHSQGLVESNFANSGRILGMWLKGNNITINHSIGKATSIKNTTKSNNLLTAGIWYAAGKEANFTHVTGTAEVNGGGKEDRSDGIHLELVKQVFLNHDTFNAQGFDPHAVYVDNQTDATIDGNGLSHGNVTLGIEGRNKVTIIGFGSKPFVLQDGETWKFPDIN